MPDGGLQPGACEDGAPALSPEDTRSLLSRCATERETDIGNGNRLLHRYGDDLQFVKGIGWHAFDGQRFREDSGGSVVRPLAHRTAEAIRFEWAEIMHDAAETVLIETGNDAVSTLAGLGADADPARVRELKKLVQDRDELEARLAKRRDQRSAHAKSSCNSAKLDNMLKEAAPYRACTVDDMNRDALALNCRNGTLRFVQDEDPESDPDDPRHVWFARLDPHRRGDLITKMAEASVATSVPFAGDIGDDGPDRGELLDEAFFEQIAHHTAPTFIEFLHRVQPDMRMRGYLRRLSGYMLTGLTGEQVIAFFFGIGANGKSTFTDVLGKILADYAVTLGIESFTGEVRRGGADATPDLARLNGAYACFASEGDETMVCPLKSGPP